MLLTKISIIAFLFMIFFEDMRSRSVHWFWFPLLAVGLCILKLKERGFVLSYEFLFSIAFNLLFLVIQLLLLTVYFSLKQKKITNITQGLLGWGDILFLICIAAYASPANFILYHVISLVAVLLIWGGYQLLLKKEHKHIPLAGLQAVIFAFIILFSWILSFSLTNDDLWIRLINLEV